MDVPSLSRLGLLLIRPGVLMLNSPAFGGVYAPAPVKIGLTLLLAITLIPSIAVPETDSALVLVAVVAREAAIGLALGMAIQALSAAAELGGQIISIQIGLSYAAIINPQSGVRNNVIATLYSNIAMMVFFLVNGHHAFLRALGASYQSLPIGGGHVGSSAPAAIASVLALVFTFAARLAAPIVVVLIITEVAMALVARSAPSLNVMAVGPPIRLVVGLVLLALVAPAATGLFSGMSQSVLRLGVQVAEVFR